MIELTQVNWRKDSVTRRYVCEHKAELATPSAMSPNQLAEATTYCQNSTNPFAEELARRAELLEKYLHTSGAERTSIVRQAAKRLNILLI